MSNLNQTEMPASKDSRSKLKMEVANELGVDLKSKNLTAKDAGRVGSEITRRLIKKAEQNR